MPMNLHFPVQLAFPGGTWWPGAIHPGKDGENSLLSFLQACYKPSPISGIPDTSAVLVVQGSEEHRSLRGTEACLPRALCSPG